nr:MAG TPA: hypothetical protein [Caudoviricetes sp.]DAQ89102.1 MAG TPA: hypothetical protein [Caudoviricetes sp.]
MVGVSVPSIQFQPLLRLFDGQSAYCSVTNSIQKKDSRI